MKAFSDRNTNAIGTFHQPKTLLHKVEKALMLETDVSEIVNEMITSVKKGGRCGLIGAYAGFTNHFNIGALMEKGVRLIGNGQAPVHKWWKEILEDYILSGKFDPTLYVPSRTPRFSHDSYSSLFGKQHPHTPGSVGRLPSIV